MVQSSSKMCSFPVSSVWFPTIYRSTLHTSGTPTSTRVCFFSLHLSPLHRIPFSYPHPEPAVSLRSEADSSRKKWPSLPSVPSWAWLETLFPPCLAPPCSVSPSIILLTQLFYHCTDVLLEWSVLSHETGTEWTPVIKGTLSWPSWLRFPEVTTIFFPQLPFEAPNWNYPWLSLKHYKLSFWGHSGLCYIISRMPRSFSSYFLNDFILQ